MKEVEEFKNEDPHVFQARRDHPFEGMLNPVAQAVMRCNVDVKYIGRNFSEADLLKFCDGSIDQEPGVEVSCFCIFSVGTVREWIAGDGTSTPGAWFVFGCHVGC